SAGPDRASRREPAAEGGTGSQALPAPGDPSGRRLRRGLVGEVVRQHRARAVVRVVDRAATGCEADAVREVDAASLAVDAPQLARAPVLDPHRGHLAHRSHVELHGRPQTFVPGGTSASIASPCASGMRTSTARRLSSRWRISRTPTIADVTAGWRSVQAVA